jgi:hypothetical protein
MRPDRVALSSESSEPRAEATSDSLLILAVELWIVEFSELTLELTPWTVEFNEPTLELTLFTCLSSWAS